MKELTYNPDKNIKLQSERGISFEEIICLINDGYVIDILEHPNQIKYKEQGIFVVDVDGYIWLIPYVEDDEKIFLKTAFPSRKHSKKYLEGKDNG